MEQRQIFWLALSQSITDYSTGYTPLYVAEACYKYNYRKEKRKERAFLPTLKHGVSSPKILMNHARLLTDQAIALLEDAVIYVLKNARESGYADIPANEYKPDPDGGHAYIRATLYR